MVDDLVEGDRQGAVGALHDRSKAVADQQYVDTRKVEDAREREIVAVSIAIGVRSAFIWARSVTRTLSFAMVSSIA